VLSFFIEKNDCPLINKTTKDENLVYRQTFWKKRKQDKEEAAGSKIMEEKIIP